MVARAEHVLGFDSLAFDRPRPALLGIAEGRRILFERFIPVTMNNV